MQLRLDSLIARQCAFVGTSERGRANSRGR
jgi:hypothetical protein